MRGACPSRAHDLSSLRMPVTMRLAAKPQDHPRKCTRLCDVFRLKAPPPQCATSRRGRKVDKSWEREGRDPRMCSCFLSFCPAPHAKKERVEVPPTRPIFLP